MEAEWLQNLTMTQIAAIEDQLNRTPITTVLVIQTWTTKERERWIVFTYDGKHGWQGATNTYYKQVTR